MGGFEHRYIEVFDNLVEIEFYQLPPLYLNEFFPSIVKRKEN